MSIANWPSIQAAIVSAIVNASETALTAGRVYWGGQNRAQLSGPNAWAALDIVSVESASPATPEQEVFEGANVPFLTAPLQLNAVQHVDVTVQIKVATQPVIGSGSAFTVLSNVVMGLGGEDRTAALGDIALIEAGRVQNLPTVLETEFKGWAFTTLRFRVRDGATQDVSWIQTYEALQVPQAWAGWTFDHDTLTKVVDTSFSGHNLNVFDPTGTGYPRRFFGKRNTARRFTNAGHTAGVVVASAHNKLDTDDVKTVLAGQWALSFWLRPLAPTVGIGANQTILSMQVNSLAGVVVTYAQATDRLTVTLSNEGAPFSAAATFDAGGATLAQDVWSHVTLVKRVATPDPIIDLYVAGVLVQSKTITFGFDPGVTGLTSNAFVSLGSLYSGTGPANTGLDGDLDEVLVFDRALTADEARAIFLHSGG